MNVDRQNNLLRVAALTVVLGVVLYFADYFCGAYHPKTLGALVAAAAVVFLFGETFFWKAIEKLTDLPKSEALNASEAGDLTARVKVLKSRLTQRWLTLLGLKVIAGVCAAWLLNQQNPNEHQRIVWLIGVGTLAASLPVALTFLRNWQQAEEIKSRQFLRAKQREELKAAKEELEKSPSRPVETSKLLKGYIKVIRNPKPKGNSH